MVLVARYDQEKPASREFDDMLGIEAIFRAASTRNHRWHQVSMATTFADFRLSGNQEKK